MELARRKTASNGEFEVEKELVKQGFNYIPEHIFDDLYNTYSHSKQRYYLRFDFAVLSRLDGHLMALIEYDGEQHYSPNDWYLSTHRIRENDIVKNEYAKRNNIPLIRIRKTDLENIDQIIKSLEGFE